MKGDGLRKLPMNSTLFHAVTAESPRWPHGDRKVHIPAMSSSKASGWSLFLIQCNSVFHCVVILQCAQSRHGLSPPQGPAQPGGCCAGCRLLHIRPTKQCVSRAHPSIHASSAFTCFPWYTFRMMCARCGTVQEGYQGNKSEHSLCSQI